MGYRSLLLVRWSRRDWLAILVVAVTVAFLTGTTLLLIATGAQTTAIAAEYDSPGSVTYYDHPRTARAVASADQIILPVAEVTNGSTNTLLVGVPDELDAEIGTDDARFRVASGNTTTLGTIETPRTERLEGPAEAATISVQPRNRRASLLAPSWYVTDTRTVERVGASGAYVVRIGSDSSGRHDDRGVPLLSVLEFFLVGSNEVLRAFAAVASGVATLVGVTVFSVSRMSVRDRLSTIRIVRSTGGRPRTVLGLFTVRAMLLTVVGVSLGYAMGVIVTNATVNLAVTIGLPTSLSLAAGPRAIRVLGILYTIVTGIGGLAGTIAAWPAAHRPPGLLARERAASHEAAFLPGSLTPSLLHWRALVPTTVTLSTFVVFVLLVSAMAGVAEPITDAEGTTITQPGSVHPIASKIPGAYAEALNASGIDASAEILLFEMIDDEPVLARGVEYENFERVTDVQLVRGRAPEEPSEALVGVDLARTRGIEIGEPLTLGGSTRVGLTRVEIVGTFAAAGPFDDQLLVSLPTARHLTRTGPNEVHLVRADRLPPPPNDRGSETSGTGIGVVDLSVDGPVSPNSSFVVAVTVHNGGLRKERVSVAVEFDDQRRNAIVELVPDRQRTIRVEFTARAPGTYVLEAGNATATVRVIDPHGLELEGIPARAPPGSKPIVAVTDRTGSPVAGATVVVGNRTVTTDGDGRVRVPLATTGRIEVTAQARNRSTTRVVEVATDATRELSTRVEVRPSEPSLMTRPEARIVLVNPWAEPVNATVRIDGPGRTLERAVAVSPGRRTVLTSRLAQRPPGSYGVRVFVDDRAVGRIEYQVTGDRRIVSALSTSGREGTTGISQAIEVVFGNFQILIGALLGLAALMSVGGTTATFAQAVYARRRTIGVHRATGAPPGRVLRVVLVDAARIGIVASVGAFVLAVLALQVLAAMGHLTVFGVRLETSPSPAVIVGTLLGSLIVTLLGATITTLALLRVSPSSLLAESEGTDHAPAVAETSTDE